VTLVGAYYFWREQLTWGDVAAAQAQAEEAEAALEQAHPPAPDTKAESPPVAAIASPEE